MSKYYNYFDDPPHAPVKLDADFAPCDLISEPPPLLLTHSSLATKITLSILSAGIGPQARSLGGFFPDARTLSRRPCFATGPSLHVSTSPPLDHLHHLCVAAELIMFHSRTNSQKPDEEFYAIFKQNFPDVGLGPLSAGPGPAQRSSSLSEARTDANLPNRYAPTIPLSGFFSPLLHRIVFPPMLQYFIHYVVVA